MYSLSRTLAVRFSLTIFIALFLIAVWAYLGAQRILREELDRDLSRAAELERAFLLAGFPLHPYPTPLSREEFVAQINRFVVVRDREGRIVASNTPLAENLPLDRDAHDLALGGDRAWTTRTWNEDAIRSLYVAVPQARRSGYAVIEVAASLEPHWDSTQKLLFLMFGTVVLGTLATAIGAFWLANSSVAPVETIAAQAESIRPGTTGQRITAHADVQELRGLITVLNQMLERLDNAFDSQRRLIADAGHDLRTPLTAMRGEIEVALRGERTSAQYRETLASLTEEVDQLISISDSLILLARLDAGELSPGLEPTDIADLVAESVRRADVRANGRTFEFMTHDSIELQVDPKMLGMVIDHILDNSIAHTPPTTHITVTVSRDASHAIIVVEDNGPGLPPDALPHLFERFYRPDSARTRTGRAGLGLSIVAAAVQAHGGTVRGEPGEQGGLRVVIQLPA